MDESGDILGALGPRQLIWHELCKRLDPVEVNEVKSIVGSDIIEGNEELGNEIGVLADILRSVQEANLHAREELAKLSKEPRLARARSAAAPTQQSTQALQQQILFFVDRIKASSSSSHTNAAVPRLPLPAPHAKEQPDMLKAELPPSLVTTPRENLIVRYVSSARPASSPSRSGDGHAGLGPPSHGRADSSSRFLSPSRRKARGAMARADDRVEAFALKPPIPQSRPPSAAARLRGTVSGGAAAGVGGGVGMAHTSRPSTAASGSTDVWSMASAPEVLDSISQRYSVFALERTAQQLRDALQEETEALQADREFLEVCMREETEVKLALGKELSQRKAAAAADSSAEGSGGGGGGDAEPTVEELKSFKSKLQSTWLTMEEEGAALDMQPRPPTPERRGGGTPPARRGGRLRAALAAQASAGGDVQRPGTASGAPGKNKAGTAAGILDDLDELFGD